MQILKFLLVVGGLAICALTAAATYAVTAFGCGMANASCRSFPMPWQDAELMAYALPPFVFGVLMVVIGAKIRTTEAGRKR
jgi:hypothetical protein